MSQLFILFENCQSGHSLEILHHFGSSHCFSAISWAPILSCTSMFFFSFSKALRPLDPSILYLLLTPLCPTHTIYFSGTPMKSLFPQSEQLREVVFKIDIIFCLMKDMDPRQKCSWGPTFDDLIAAQARGDEWPCSEYIFQLLYQVAPLDYDSHLFLSNYCSGL